MFPDGPLEYHPEGTHRRIRDLEAQLAAANVTYQRDSAAWHELQDTLVRQRDEALRHLAAANADCAAMRAALEGVACVGTYGSCVRCGAAWDHPHTSDCIVGAALATDAGKTLLAQMAAMRTALERARVWLVQYVKDDLEAGELHGFGCYGFPEERAAPTLGSIDDALTPDAGAHTLAKLARLERIEAAARAWQAAWDAAEAFQRHEHTWADGTRDYSDGLWQTETERALDLKATLEAK
jgi:RNA polymerase-binding transcription factor DksA